MQRLPERGTPFPVTGVRDAVNVLDFGADPTGTFDHTTAIQDAVTKTIALGGGVVYFPPGKYRISRPITVTGAVVYLKILGVGTPGGTGNLGGSTISPTEGFTGSALLDFGDNSTLCERFEVEGMTLCGRKPSGTDMTAAGIRIRKCAQFNVVRNYFSATNGRGLQIGDSTAGADSSVGLVDGNVFGSACLVGLYMHRVSAVRVVNNEFIEGRVGGGATSKAIDAPFIGPAVVIGNNRFADWEGDYAIDVVGTSASQPGVIVGNNFSQVKGGISCAQEGGCTIVGNAFSNPKTTPNQAIVALANDIAMVGNAIYWAGGNGVRLQAENGTFVGNTIGNSIIGVDINGGIGYAIVGNRIYDDAIPVTMTHGIKERNGANSNLVASNRISNAATASLILIGAASGEAFFGAAASPKPTVTGSRGANAALASLLTALAGLGLLTDSSS